jgi:hypothetical protein
MSQVTQTRNMNILTMEIGGCFPHAYRYSNNVRRHGVSDCIYPLPNDLEELDRLDQMHFVFFVHHDLRNVLVPFTSMPNQILDLGSGSGLWVGDVAFAHGFTKVIAFDLAPLEPFIGPPSNMESHTGDFNWGLGNIYESDSFDLVHSR